MEIIEMIEVPMEIKIIKMSSVEIIEMPVVEAVVAVISVVIAEPTEVIVIWESLIPEAILIVVESAGRIGIAVITASIRIREVFSSQSWVAHHGRRMVSKSIVVVPVRQLFLTAKSPSIW
jgi:hypothetical protein